MIKEFEYCYDRIVCTGVEENPPLQIRSKKRGRNKQTTAKNLLDRFMNYKNDIVGFMYDLKVPFENNLTERDVRMMRVRQKDIRHVPKCARSTLFLLYNKLHFYC